MKKKSLLNSLVVGLAVLSSLKMSAQTWKQINVNVPGTICGVAHAMETGGNRLYVLGLSSGVYASTAITFIRSKITTGVTLIPQVPSYVMFNDSLGSTVESVVDLGNGTERVTIRSNASMATQTA